MNPDGPRLAQSRNVPRFAQSPDEQISELQEDAAGVLQCDSSRGKLLTRILKQRRRPLMLVIGSEGDLLFSSVPESAPASEHRLLGQALVEARSLFQGNSELDQEAGHGTGAVMDRPGQRSILAFLGNEFYSLRVITLHGFGDDADGDQFAALVEPIVEPLAIDVDFELVKDKFRLSNREGDVLVALMSGAKDKEIARCVNLTTGTVRTYLKSIRAKLGVSNRTAIVNLVHEFSTSDPTARNGH